MLWTRKYAPRSTDDILHSDTKELVQTVRDERLNSIFYGPRGSGKSSVVMALASEGGADVSVVNIRDIFSSTNKELSNDPRYSRFVGGNKRDTMINALKESAVGINKKIVLVDNAESIRRDFQEALRRIVEKRDVQFIVTTRSLSVFIPAIRSRFFPVRFKNPTKEETINILEDISKKENLEYTQEGLEYIYEASSNLRESIYLLQAVSTQGKIMEQQVFEIVQDIDQEETKDIVELAEDGKLNESIEILEQHQNPIEILDYISSYRSPSSVELASEIEEEITEGIENEIHLKHLLSKISSNKNK